MMMKMKMALLHLSAGLLAALALALTACPIEEKDAPDTTTYGNEFTDPINVVFKGVTASPLASTNQKTTALIFTFDKDIQGLGVNDITLGTTDNPLTTTKTGVTRTEIGVYKLEVSGVINGARGPKTQYIGGISKTGYDITGIPADLNVPVYYEAAAVTGISLNAVSPTDTTIPETFEAWPFTWTLSADVTANDDSIKGATFSVNGGSITGVTLTASGTAGATLSIDKTCGAETVTITATSSVDATKTASKTFTIAKNLGAVADDAAFAAALEGDSDPIYISIRINTPASATTTSKNIIIRSGGELVIAENFTANGNIKVLSGGKVEIAPDDVPITPTTRPPVPILTIGTSGELNFGSNDDVKFLPGQYTSRYAAGTFVLNGKTVLSYNGAAKAVTIGGDENGVLSIKLDPAGMGNDTNNSSAALGCKAINFPVGYSLIIEKDFYLSGYGPSGTTSSKLKFDFGPLTDDTNEAGLAFGTGGFKVVDGDAVFTATTDGVELATTVSGGSMLNTSGLYCAPDKALRFASEAGGKYPLTIKGIPSILAASGMTAAVKFTVQSENGGGVKIRAYKLADDTNAANDSVFFLGASGTNQLIVKGSANTKLGIAVERIGAGSGTLSFISNTANLAFMSSAFFTEINLGGTSASAVGRIVLKPQKKIIGQRGNGADSYIKTGNTPSSSTDATYAFGADSAFTVNTTFTLTGTNQNGPGYFASAFAFHTNNPGPGEIVNSNADGGDDIVLDSTTVVNGME